MNILEVFGRLLPARPVAVKLMSVAYESERFFAYLSQRLKTFGPKVLKWTKVSIRAVSKLLFRTYSKIRTVTGRTIVILLNKITLVIAVT